MKNNLRKTIEGLSPGDLICCSWFDASSGRSSVNGGIIDVPVRSWGVYLGLIGSKTKHLILAQNSFKFLDGLYDLDYTAIPLGWAIEIDYIQKAHLPESLARQLVKCLVTENEARKNTGGLRSPRVFQHRLSRDGRRF